jgi:hypothetical protein
VSCEDKNCACEGKCLNCECVQADLLCPSTRAVPKSDLLRGVDGPPELRIRVIDIEPVSKALKLPADVRLTAEPPHITVQDVRGITVGPTVRRIKVDENAKLFDICGVNPETYLKET